MKKSLAFRVIGFSLVALAFLSFAADVVFRALHGGWNETYYSAKLVSWTYGGAFIVLCALGLVALVGLFFGLVNDGTIESARERVVGEWSNKRLQNDRLNR